MNQKHVLCVAMVSVFGAVASAEVVAGWVAGGIANSPTIPAPATVVDLAGGLLGEGLSRGAGLDQISNSPFSSRGFTAGGFDDAVAENDYIAFGLTVASGLSLDLDSLRLRYRGASSNSPTMLSVLVSTDAFLTSTTLFTDEAVSTQAEVADIALSLTGLTGEVSFRIYGWQASSVFGGLTILPFGANLLQDQRGIILEGAVVPTVPTMGVLVMGLFAASRRRRG